MGKLVSIIIVTYNSTDWLKQCLKSLIKHTKYPYEIIIIDNASCKEHLGYLRYLDKQKKVKMIFNDENLYYTKGCNQGIKLASGKYILLLNPDVIIIEDNWLSNFIKDLEGIPDSGIAGCKMLYRNTDRIAFAGGIGWTWHRGFNRENGPGVYDSVEVCSGGFDLGKGIEWMTGSCMLIKREVINKIGLLDEKHSHFSSDSEYCIRAKNNGFKVVYSPVTIRHFWGMSSKDFKIANLTEELQQIMDKLNKLENRKASIDKELDRTNDIKDMNYYQCIKKLERIKISLGKVEKLVKNLNIYIDAV